jgi:hypothetical protein
MSTDRAKERVVVTIKTADTPTEGGGDNRRAGDTDSNAAGGDTKSKGPTNPADKPPAQRREPADKS